MYLFFLREDCNGFPCTDKSWESDTTHSLTQRGSRRWRFHAFVIIIIPLFRSSPAKRFYIQTEKECLSLYQKKSSKRLTNFWYLALGLFPLPVLFQSFRVRIMSFSPFISTTRRLSFYLFLAHTICPLSFSFYSPYYMAFNSLLP